MNERDIKKLKWNKNTSLLLEKYLYLNVRRSSKTFIFQKMVRGQRKMITIGQYPQVSLKDARDKAEQLAALEDPDAFRMNQLIDSFWPVVKVESKVPDQIEGYLNYIRLMFGDRNVVQIERHELVTCIHKYSVDRGHRTADRLRGYLKRLFEYGIELGRMGRNAQSPMVEVTKRMAQYYPEPRNRVLTDEEIKMVFSWSSDSAQVLQFLLLTGLRISESRNGYPKDDIFHIDDTKGRHKKCEKKPHWVFLTERSKALLPLPLLGVSTVQNWLREKLLGLGYTNEKANRFTPHDCRRTFVTRANGSGCEPFIVERCVNHKLEGVMATYNHEEYVNERIEVFKVLGNTINVLLNDE